MPYATPSHYSYAWDKLKETTPDWSIIIAQRDNPKNWSEYYYYAKVKEILKDWAGAKADLEEAWVNRPDNITLKKMIAQELEDVGLMIK